ncbi:MgtC/SapB family protein [Pseudochryseolinea flava]|uniref:MgtC/SapB family protein n=1 Tax=Pseudochryseolinea flava TaxID=2059302 RepID=A0A364XXF0_9BACT|nr:MgtC/SapB family protein [Pseudochryseolinea flava]RAV99076.1 MgtC/SapB family protein [Pseudochryseolinea flava]
MEIDLQFDLESAFRLFLSFVIGTAIGMEREYRSKAAGLRTIIMICLGATIFTEISIAIGGASPDRIASTVVTGIGFLGAGVIFRDGLTVSGITTATTIWISAALGMAVGAGEYFIALSGSVIVIVVLTLFEKVKLQISRQHQARTYKIEFERTHALKELINVKLSSLQLRYLQERDMKKEDSTILVYEVFGTEARLEAFNAFLKEEARIKCYEY